MISSLINRFWILALLSFWSVQLTAAITLTNVTVVNVTPSTFSVLWRSTEPGTPSISVYADASGTTNLAGEVGIEPYPLMTGSIHATDKFSKRAIDRSIRDKTKNFSQALVRISGCRPNTTYYFRVQSTATNGSVATWPLNGPLASVKTGLENTFVVRSKQLLLDIPGTNVQGRIVTLGASNTTAKLAAVVGDGTGTNQAFFNLSDLLALVGGTNYIPVGNIPINLELLPSPSDSSIHVNYVMVFNPGTSLSDLDVRNLGAEFMLISGTQTILEPGTSGNVTFSLASSHGAREVAFGIPIPRSRLTNLTLQILAPEIFRANLFVFDSNSYGIDLAMHPGQSIQGTQQVVRLHFNAVSNQSPAIIRLDPFLAEGAKPDSSPYGKIFAQAGRIIVVGDQPLLEALLLPETSSRHLALYARPGAVIDVEGSINMSTWTNSYQRTLTGFSTTITNVPNTENLRFFRAINRNPSRQSSEVIEDRPQIGYTIRE